MRRIASFDIGASHLACVVVDADAKTVIHWSKDALPSLNSRDVVQYVRSLPLDPHAALTALVEQQPAIWVQSTRTWTTNPKMLRLEGMISSALAALGAEVIHRATSHKTAYLNANKALLARTYKDRKHLGVALVRDVVLPLHADGGPVADGLCTFFADPREKKDDLADALLQALAYLGIPANAFAPAATQGPAAPAAAPEATPPEAQQPASGRRRRRRAPAPPLAVPRPEPPPQRATRRAVVVEISSGSEDSEHDSEPASDSGSVIMLD